MRPEPRTVGVGVAGVAAAVGVAWLGPAAALGALTALTAPMVARLTGGRWLTGIAWAAAAAGSSWERDPAEILAVALCGMGARRLLVRALHADRVPLVLSTLALLVAAARVDGTALVVPALVHGAAFPLALTSARARLREVTWVAIGAAIASVAAFLLAPRLVGESNADRTGFAEQVELGVMDELLDDPAVVFRARWMPDPDDAPVWRGRALDHFDGRSWTSSGHRVAVDVSGPRLLPEDALVAEVVPEGRADVVFTAGQVVDLRTDGPSPLTDGRGGFAAPGATRWRIVVLPPLGVGAKVAWDDDPGDLAAAVALPADLDPRVHELAAQVAGEGTPVERVDRLVAHLRAQYRYTRTPLGRGDPAPLATFLFDTHAGHCEYFATALAVLARSAGVPSRVVNGYAAGEVGADGWSVVRARDAHAWVEVWTDGAWRAVDATPVGAASTAASPPWSPPVTLPWRAFGERMLAYDREAQLSAVLAVSRALEPRAIGVPWRGLAAATAMAAVGCLMVVFGVRRAVPKIVDPPAPRLDVVGVAHRTARARLAARGVRPPATLAPVAAAEWAQSEAPGDATDALLALAWLWYEVRLGGRDPADARAAAEGLLARVREP